MHPSIMPSRVAEIRKAICKEAGCQHPDEEFFLDPCSSCRGNFGVYSSDCQTAAPAILHKPSTPTQPWPLLALPFKLLAVHGDTGLGDIVARIVGPIGGAAYKVWYKKTFNKPCGCNERQDSLNQKFPL